MKKVNVIMDKRSYVGILNDKLKEIGVESRIIDQHGSEVEIEFSVGNGCQCAEKVKEVEGFIDSKSKELDSILEDLNEVLSDLRKGK